MGFKKLTQIGQSLLVVSVALVLAACGSNKTTSSSSNGVYGPNANGYYGGIFSNSNEAGYLGDNFAWKTMTISNADVFKSFIKKIHGVCDIAANSGGIYNCNSWASSYFRIIYQANSNYAAQSRIVFMTYPQVSNYYWYGYQLPSWDQFFQGLMGFPVPTQVSVARDPIALDLTVSNINNSQGFEGRGYGAADSLGRNSLVQFQVATGKVLDNQISFTLSFEGKTFASGYLLRCTYGDCR